MITDDCKQFLRPDGRLSTTQENMDFLAKYDLEHDTSKFIYLKKNSEMKTIASEFGVTLMFCPRHLIQPHHLKYFDPRGHPLAGVQRARLASMAETQPLWLMTNCVGGPKATVRITATRRLRSSLYTALQAKGYDKFGKGADRELKGTLLISLQNPAKAVLQQMDRFGPALVRQLEEQCFRSPAARSNASSNSNMKWEDEPRKRNFRPRSL